MIDFLREAQGLFEYTRDLRRDFHQHPELGFQEVRTAGIVARELNQLGLEVSTGVGKTGVVATLEGGNPGPVILARFDMDALPIQEETGAEYASQTPGVMHACGHDGHTAAGLAVARILEAHKAELNGTVKLVFQPAEEGLGGAEAMLADGVLENPRPDRSLSMHMWNEKPVGWIGVTPGPAMSASDRFTVKIIGRGGHGAAPHLGVDPVVAGAQVISALQNIVSRNVPPLESAVVTVTSMTGGEAFNVIPETVELRGTIRSFKPEVRDLVLERFQEIVVGVSEAMGCQVEVALRKITPATINDLEMAERVRGVASRILPQAELDTDECTMGSEDMAYLMDDIPGCYFFVGSANHDQGLDAAHHHPKFDFDESALPRAAALMAASVVEFLDKN
ncbi:MAG: amidohydrolase [Chloroflexota bacterium]|nr:MAG: amidohydrolase [Chloroflexota bacterium]